MVERGRFRADLLDRLSFEVITLPPLRVRDGDVALLAGHFGARMAAELDWPRWPGFGEAAMAALVSYHWPGNVRELRNVVERAVYRWDDAARPVDIIDFDPFASPWWPVPASMETVPVTPPLAPREEACDDLRAACEAYERRLLEAALVRCRYNQRVTATALKLTYDQLRHALKRHGMIETAPRT